MYLRGPQNKIKRTKLWPKLSDFGMFALYRRNKASLLHEQINISRDFEQPLYNDLDKNLTVIDIFDCNLKSFKDQRSDEKILGIKITLDIFKTRNNVEYVEI
jgi:hypothetical protein